MPGTFNPNTNLSCDTRMWTAAAVVKPDTRVSDRYTTMKPTCRTPRASYTRIEEQEEDEEAGLQNPNKISNRVKST